MRALPNLPDIGNFHIGPGRDANYQLPVFERYKDCEVLIELATPTTVSRTSWLAVGLAATQLNIACVNDKEASLGGKTAIGDARSNDIKITIRGFERRPRTPPASTSCADVRLEGVNGDL